MNHLKLFLLGILLLAPWAVFADQVTCESVGNGRQECEMDTRGNVRLDRQLSKTRCVEDQNWGYSKYGLWVDGGCRGVFVSDGGPHGSSNQSSGGGYSPTQVTCESVGNGRQECEMDTSGPVRLDRQLSKTRCVEDQNWGYSKYGLWVDGGCRGVFVSGGGGSHSSGPSEPSRAQIAACDGVRNWSGQVMSSTALEAGAWEIILYYGDREGKYVCNVDRNLDVSYFERLRNQ